MKKFMAVLVVFVMVIGMATPAMAATATKQINVTIVATDNIDSVVAAMKPYMRDVTIDGQHFTGFIKRGEAIAFNISYPKGWDLYYNQNKPTVCTGPQTNLNWKAAKGDLWVQIWAPEGKGTSGNSGSSNNSGNGTNSGTKTAAAAQTTTIINNNTTVIVNNSTGGSTSSTNSSSSSSSTANSGGKTKEEMENLWTSLIKEYPINTSAEYAGVQSDHINMPTSDYLVFKVPSGWILALDGKEHAAGHTLSIGKGKSPELWPVGGVKTTTSGGSNTTQKLDKDALWSFLKANYPIDAAAEWAGIQADGHINAPFSSEKDFEVPAGWILAYNGEHAAGKTVKIAAGANAELWPA